MITVSCYVYPNSSPFCHIKKWLLAWLLHLFRIWFWSQGSFWRFTVHLFVVVYQRWWCGWPLSIGGFLAVWWPVKTLDKVTRLCFAQVRHEICLWWRKWFVDEVHCNWLTIQNVSHNIHMNVKQYFFTFTKLYYELSVYTVYPYLQSFIDNRYQEKV